MNAVNTLTQHTKINVRPSQLVVSPLNVRKEPRSVEYIEELAASIKANGLMHALTVHEMPKKRGQQLYGVAAGGGRNEAIQLLLSRGEINDERDLVECNLIEDGSALRASVAENVHRLPLHPADEYEGFRRMIDGGESIEDTAAAFGVTPLVVERRMRLANVEPSFLALFRAGKIKLDQLMALAATPDHARQLEVWEECEHNRTAGAIRRAIVGTKIDASRHPLARFVGVEAYTAAGGALERDLFAAVDGGGFMLDGALLERLAGEKLEAVAESVRAEGWAWVEVSADAGIHDYHRAPYGRREPTEEEAAQMAALSETIQNYYEPEDEEYREIDDESEEHRAIEAAEAELEALRDTLIVYTPEVKAVAGAVVCICTETGMADVWRGRLRPQDRKAAEQAALGEPSTPAKAPAAAGMSEALTRRLTAHKTRAMQALLAQRPDVALPLLAYRLAAPLFYKGVYLAASVLPVRLDDARLDGDADDLSNAPATAALEALYQTLKAKLPKKSSDLFGWLLAQPQEEVAALLAFCLAGGLNAVESRETKNADNDRLCEALSLDMADWWSATGSTYFNFVKKDEIVAAVKEAVSPAAARSLADMKKGPMVEEAEKQVAGKRWLPKLLRHKKPTGKAK